VSKNCGCAYCKNDNTFEKPKHLIDELVAGNVVVFAGAGISTENRDHAKDTFYDKIAHEIGQKDAVSFPKLMERYCTQPDGRIKFIQALKNHFDYYISFSDFYKPMTKFHRSISPLYMINTVITTNWDDFFERECDFDAFVNDSDMALWGASKRRLMKIHGSIRNLGSIVATEADYAKSYRTLNNGPMGAQLKTIMNQKTVLYTGYSLSDDNYIRLARNIAKVARPHIKASYYVSPHIDKTKLAKFPIPLIPIETDGAYFFEQLRIHLEKSIHLTPDRAFWACEKLLKLVAEAHNRTADAYLRSKHPLCIFALSYQDGLIHALQRIRDRRRTGEYHNRHHLIHLVHGYDHKIAEYGKRGDYWNACYAEGYSNGILFLISRSLDSRSSRPPIYGVVAKKIFTSLSAVTKTKITRIPRRVLQQSNRILAQSEGSEESLIPDHTPYV
jgi:NAD-dependent SIR2 family protein deacetylase